MALFFFLGPLHRGVCFFAKPVSKSHTLHFKVARVTPRFHIFGVIPVSFIKSSEEHKYLDSGFAASPEITVML